MSKFGINLEDWNMTTQNNDHTPPRITFKVVWNSLLDLFSLEKGIFHTLWCLLIRPGKMVYNYLFEDRTKDIKPFKFLIFTTALAVLVSVRYSSMEANFLEGLDAGIEMNAKKNDKSAAEIAEMKEGIETYKVFAHKVFNDYANLVFLIAIPITSFFTFLFFRSSQFYYTEHLVLKAYLQGFQNLLFVLSFPLLFKFPESFIVYLAIAIGYAIYAYKDVFDTKWSTAIFKGIAAQLCGVVGYYLVLMIVLGVALFVIVP